jgi:hypothetical protein
VESWRTSIGRRRCRRGALETAVIYRDTFGNLKLGALTAELIDALDGVAHGDRLVVTLTGRPVTMVWAPTFGKAPWATTCCTDSYGRCARQNRATRRSRPAQRGACAHHALGLADGRSGRRELLAVHRRRLGGLEVGRRAGRRWRRFGRG